LEVVILDEGQDPKGSDDITPVRTITIKLSPEVVQQLGELCVRHGLSRTDVINRSFTLYEWVEGIMASSELDLLVRDPETGDVMQLVFK
jgi:hypothetical protein